MSFVSDSVPDSNRQGTSVAQTRRVDLLTLITELLEFRGTVILRNEFGTMELRGTDLALKHSDEWITLYHASAANSEHRSHLHLRRSAFAYAEVIEREGGTAQVGFWKTKADVPAAVLQPADSRTGKPPFAMFFAPFYDWSGPEKKALPENQARFAAWLNQNGRAFTIM